MGLMDKVRVAIFGDFEEEPIDDFYEDDAEEFTRPRPGRDSSKKDMYENKYQERDLPPLRPVEKKEAYSGNGKVLNFHTNVQMEFYVTSPGSFEDAQEICDNIRRNSPVVVNLEKVEQLTAQRLMDFISGACYSLDGSIQRVSNNIFLIAPNNIAISSDLKEELRTSAFINPWANV